MLIPVQFKYVALIVLFALASVNFTKTALEIVNNSKRLDSLHYEVSSLKQEKADLDSIVAYKQTDQYVEEKARNDLNMIKPGEKVYVLEKISVESGEFSPEAVRKGVATSVLGASATDESNLSSWLKLFL